MNILEWLVVFAAVGALSIILVPHVYRSLWVSTCTRGYLDWVAYRTGACAYPVYTGRIAFLRRAYNLGIRQAQHSVEVGES